MLISVSWGWYKEWETEERKMKGFWLKQNADVCNFVICFLSWKSILKTLWIRCFECSGSHAVTYHGRSFSICCYSVLSFSTVKCYWCLMFCILAISTVLWSFRRQGRNLKHGLWGGSESTAGLWYLSTDVSLLKQARLNSD